jgi:hypothetical protein
MLLTLVCVLGLVSVAYASDYRTTNRLDLEALQAAKDAMPHGKPVYAGRVGGEDIANAVPVPGIPFNDTGNTCQFLNDYDEECPYTDSTSPDVVYVFTPQSNMQVDIDLCGSLYDTKVYVRTATGALVGCNDDYYFEDPCGVYTSCLECLPLSAGTTYYIFIDGYGGDCGEYTLSIEECVGCELQCPDGAILENEPACFDYINDIWNVGCNGPSSIPPGPEVFEMILPECDGGVVLCGTSGTGYYPDYGNYRDTDWYEIIITKPELLTVCATGEFPMQLFLIDGNAGCGVITVLAEAYANPCEMACLEWNVVPGTYWVWVGPQVFEGIPCASDYILTLDGYWPPSGPSTTRRSSWGTIKTQYKKW